MDSHALLPQSRVRRWPTGGLTPRQETVFNWVGYVVAIAMVAAWAVAASDARKQARHEAIPPTVAPPPSIARTVESKLLDTDVPSTAYIDDAALSFLAPLHGHSGKVNLVLRRPGEKIATGEEPGLGARLEKQGGGAVAESPDFAAPQQSGVYNLAVELGKTTREVRDLTVATLVPFAEKRGGKIGLYYLGNWPYERGGTPRSAAYANPSGFIEVTPQNVSTHVSEHFTLGDFLTKGQGNVWPKYLLLDPRLLDKLELVIDELNREGYNVRRLKVMSGFRTPSYNYTGGNTEGRANLSRHMFGDASDVFVDNNDDNWTDDVNHDGRVDRTDSEIVAHAADVVERKYPALVGGVGIYSACCGHGPFTHIDVRGYRARWFGTGSG